MFENYRSGYLVGTGAAQNVSLGWIPETVRTINLTDNDIIYEGHLAAGAYIVPFSSGGTTEIAAGNKIVGATSAAEAWVKEVLLASGTWAAGTAAGFFVVDMISGTFGSENVYVGTGTNDATVTANVNHAVSITDSGSGTTDIAAATGNAAISRYAGSSTPGSEAAQGFTIGSTISEAAKLIKWEAFRSSPSR